MKKTTLLILINICLLGNFLHAQKLNLGVVAFYNLENLFDVEDDPKINDDDFTPEGRKKWNQERYDFKLKNMAKVISQLGGEQGPSILGVCEIENKKVLEDLVQTDLLKKHNYKIVHANSPDRRGIDCGLIYKANYFKPFSYQNRALIVPEIKDMITRDQLVVSGVFDTDTLHFIVNHWPSRRGGEKRSEPRREAAGKLCRSIVDSLGKIYKNPKIMIMGDFNDDPANNSIRKALGAKGDAKKLKNKGDLFNPMYKMHKKGLGTLAHGDRWQIFDMIIMSKALIGENSKYYYYDKSARIFTKDWMKQQEGRYKGYPLRTYVGPNFQGGYSDHFPVYVYIIRKLKN